MPKTIWKRLIVTTIAIAILLRTTIVTNAVEGDPFTEPVKMRCTCYIDSGTTASGQQTRYGIMAAKREWMGCVAEINAINPDGTIGEFIGYYEILDTGYGIETGIGESKIKKGRTMGSIEAGESVDLYMPTLSQAKDWVSTYGDYVYIKIIRGQG